MAVCYRRKMAWLLSNDDGSQALLFKRPKSGNFRPVTVPCGKCVACRVNNAAAWATRAYHESQYVHDSCFVTLTYDPDHCPKDYCINKRDVQLFLKRLRKDYNVRAYFACGEYGTRFGRPHYHILLLGFCPPDLQWHSKSYSGMDIYTSKYLESKWQMGFCPVGTCTCASAAYVARYAKKATATNVGDRTPPFFLASRNIKLSNGKQGALGSQWVIDNHKALRFGYLRHPSKPDVRVRIPDYYFNLLERWYPDEYELIKQLRYDYAMEQIGGVYLVEDANHEPSVTWLDDAITDDDIRSLQEFVGSDSTDFQYLLKCAADTVKRLDRYQADRLGKLKRNVE